MKIPALSHVLLDDFRRQVLHNDDTSMKVLGLMKELASTKGDSSNAPERTGVFTSGIVSTRDGQKIALFFTGRKHAGENLSTVLARRAAALGPPIQMCDALSRNLPKPLQVILGYCLTHGRRRFVEVAPNFPSECRYVLEALGEIYHYDELAGTGHDARGTAALSPSSQRFRDGGAARMAYGTTLETRIKALKINKQQFKFA